MDPLVSDVDETVHSQSDTESDEDEDIHSDVAEEAQESKTGINIYITHRHPFPLSFHGFASNYSVANFQLQISKKNNL